MTTTTTTTTTTKAACIIKHDNTRHWGLSSLKRIFWPQRIRLLSRSILDWLSSITSKQQVALECRSFRLPAAITTACSGESFVSRRRFKREDNIRARELRGTNYWSNVASKNTAVIRNGKRWRFRLRLKARARMSRSSKPFANLLTRFERKLDLLSLLLYSLVVSRIVFSALLFVASRF